MTVHRVSMRGIAVAFGGPPVLDGAELEVEAGEVHALLGENGAGKSTLARVLAGVVQPRGGAMELDGEPYAPTGPHDAARHGVAMIHQELSVIPHLGVADNVLLGNERRRGVFVDRRARNGAAQAALAFLDRLELPLDALVGRLPPAQRQVVEIARALAQDARVLLMDEPTSSLGSDDVERLFAAIAALRDRGLAIVYTSHFLAEVRRVCTRATVLRDGRTVACDRLDRLDDAALVDLMAGRSVTAAESAASRHASGDVALEVDGLGGDPLPLAASFELRRGEILGIGGLCGAGRTELLETLFGLRPLRAGTVRWEDGAPGTRWSAAQAWRNGVGFVAEDRKSAGLALQRPIAVNATLPMADRLRTGPWLPPRALAGRCAPLLNRLAVRCRGPWQRTGELSGGNQQKVALLRLLAAECAVLLLDEPTRGIDVGSRHEIYRLLFELANDGAAILFVSSQLPELLLLADRIAMMRGGVLGPFVPRARCTESSLLAAALGTAGVAS